MPQLFTGEHQDKEIYIMGNCFRRDSSIVWAGDDWEEYSTTPERHHIAEKEGLLADHDLFSSLPSSSSNREIKIKITKKQLEELLGRMDKHEVPADQVLSRLINASEHTEVLRQRSWRPRLQSIPEVN